MKGRSAMASINGDLSVPAAEDTLAMDWSPSPSGTVWRKRVHLVGPPESGQVTSVVRYEPGATFPSHDHPGGEEILVLEGVFSDEHGDWPAGTYLLNPEGFRHEPFSREGCLLFVKLRQYAGRDRDHVVIATDEIDWQPGPTPYVDVKLLYAQQEYDDAVHLERWQHGATLGPLSYPTGAEIFVLDGEFTDETGEHRSHSWLRLPAGTVHMPETAAGCTLYIKRGGLVYLRDAADEA